MENPKQTKKERKEELKALRKGSSTNYGGLVLKLAGGVFVLLLIIGAIYLYTKPAPKDPNLGQTFEDQGGQHSTQGEKIVFQYNSNPPTSGPHWPEPAACTVYGEQIADEAALHSLEHGAVWISYKDQKDTELVKKLEALVKDRGGKVLLSHRPENDSKIAAASWTRVLKLESFDEKQIKDFIKFYTNKSPEPLGACPAGEHSK